MKKYDRVKVSPQHRGTGLQARTGTVHRITPGGLVEVDLDNWDPPGKKGGKKEATAGIGLVAFKPEDLVPFSKPRKKPYTGHLIGVGLLDGMKGLLTWAEFQAQKGTQPSPT